MLNAALFSAMFYSLNYCCRNGSGRTDNKKGFFFFFFLTITFISVCYMEQVCRKRALLKGRLLIIFIIMAPCTVDNRCNIYIFFSVSA